MADVCWRDRTLCRFTDICSFNCSSRNSCCRHFKMHDFNGNVEGFLNKNKSSEGKHINFERFPASLFSDDFSDASTGADEVFDGRIESLLDRKKSLQPERHSCLKSRAGRSPRSRRVVFADYRGLPLTEVREFTPDKEEKVINDVKPKILNNMMGQVYIKSLIQVPEEPTLRQKVNEQNVCLESVVVSERDVMGVVRVKNIGYHKSVKIRKTKNNWKSFIEIPASYIHNSCDGETDKFAFALLDIGLANNSVYSLVEFAICYSVEGKEYWDNNGQKNYSFECFTS